MPRQTKDHPFNKGFTRRIKKKLTALSMSREEELKKIEEFLGISDTQEVENDTVRGRKNEQGILPSIDASNVGL